MAKLLKKTKQEYVDYIVNFMHKNHTSLWTLEDTREKWQTKRKYDINIEQQLISKTKTFVSVHCFHQDLNFRRRVLIFAAEYLSKYTVRNPKKQNDQHQAYIELNATLLAWLNTFEQRKSAAKAKNTDTQKNIQKASCNRSIRITNNGEVTQKVVSGDKTIEFKYESIAAYRAHGMADLKNAYQK